MEISPFTEEETSFRRTVRRFLDRELEPHYKSFEAEGQVPRAFWQKAGAAGILGPSIPKPMGARAPANFATRLFQANCAARLATLPSAARSPST